MTSYGIISSILLEMINVSMHCPFCHVNYLKASSFICIKNILDRNTTNSRDKISGFDDHTPVTAKRFRSFLSFVRLRFFHVLPGIRWDFVRDPTMTSGIFQDTSGFFQNDDRDIPQLPQMSTTNFHTSSCPCHNRCDYIQIGKRRYRWYLYEGWV